MHAAHALVEPPVSPATVGASGPPTPQLDQRRIVIRLRDGETILVGGAPDYERALVLAQKTIAKPERRQGRRVADARRPLRQPGRNRLGRRAPLVVALLRPR